MLFLVRYKRGL